MSDQSRRLRVLRRTPLLATEQWPKNLVDHPEHIAELIPHRPPMLLVDHLVGWDSKRELMVGQRQIDDDHLGLAGHFPSRPVLPGTLLLEMLGQVGVALFRLLLEEELAQTSFEVRATKILGAHFVAEVHPGDQVDLVVQAAGYDTFLGECEAQALVDGKIVAAMAGEVMVM